MMNERVPVVIESTSHPVHAPPLGRSTLKMAIVWPRQCRGTSACSHSRRVEHEERLRSAVPASPLPPRKSVDGGTGAWPDGLELETGALHVPAGTLEKDWKKCPSSAWLQRSLIPTALRNPKILPANGHICRKGVEVEDRDVVAAVSKVRGTHTGVKPPRNLLWPDARTDRRPGDFIIW